MLLKTHKRKTYKQKRNKKKRTYRHKKKRTYRHKKKRLTGGMDEEQAQKVRVAQAQKAQAQKAAQGTKAAKAAQMERWRAASLRPPVDWHASAMGAVVPAAKRSGVSEAEGSCWTEDFKEEDCCYGMRPPHPLEYYRGTGELPIDGDAVAAAPHCWNDNAGNATEYTYEKCCPWYSICNAAYVGDIKKIRDSQVDVNKRNIHGETPMHYAAISDNDEAIKSLKEKGFDVDAKDNSGWSAVNHASATHSFKSLRALKEVGAFWDKREVPMNDERELALRQAADAREWELRERPAPSPAPAPAPAPSPAPAPAPAPDE